ncbi:MAG: ribose 5-phosphate isomerase B [Myxococcaceae bacterium]|nr:ribose 5-phosphate isomerase B [Myxococcaceae bacterium]
MSKYGNLAIASDHAGYQLKEQLIGFLANDAHILDLGTDHTDAVDYPDFALKLGKAIHEEKARRGILICGSGVGASMAANKISGIRAGLCHDTYSAHQGVEHDHMNVLVLGARVIGLELAKEVVTRFLNATESQDERHLRRLQKMTQLENPT